MQVPFKHNTNGTTMYVKYGSPRYDKLNGSHVWSAGIELSDEKRKSLDAGIERKKEARAAHGVEELFKTGGIRLLAKIQPHFYTIDLVLDSTPEQISEVSGIPIGKATSIYNSAVSYMNVSV